MRAYVLVCHAQLFGRPWTVISQAPLWNSPGNNTGVGSPCLSPGDLSDLEMEARPLAFQAYSSPSGPPEEPVQ